MAAPIALALLVTAAFLAGSVPFGLIVGLSRGVDVRRAGSNNIGASNVGRLLGRRFFFLVLGLDAAKGLLPMLIASAVVRAGHAAATPAVYGLWMAVGFAAIVGHMFSPLLKFRGGKGVATMAGVLLGLWPFYTYPALVMLGVFLTLFLSTGYISLGSIGAAVTFPISYLALALMLGWSPIGQQWPLMGFSIVVAVLVIYKHRGNIARLRAGTENRSKRPA